MSSVTTVTALTLNMLGKKKTSEDDNKKRFCIQNILQYFLQIVKEYFA